MDKIKIIAQRVQDCVYCNKREGTHEDRAGTYSQEDYKKKGVKKVYARSLYRKENCFCF
jgi:hypothetical protein